LLGAVLCLPQVSQAQAEAPFTAQQSGRVRMVEPVHSFHSHSGQFVVALPRSSSAPARILGLATNQALVRLEPTLLTVSCERIKQLLWREIGATAPWQGKIFVVLFPAASDNDPMTITCEHSADGWRYRLELPDTIARPRFVRAMVQVLLLEMANRNANERAAEIPAWLAEGLTQQLRASSEMEIILPPPSRAAGGIAIATSEINAQKAQPLERAHRELCAHPALTFEQLSWATPDQFAGANGNLYTASAQLFVQELLQFNDGPACLRALLAELPRFYNWQLAFLRAFRSHFQRPLDAEKWWALRVVHFTGRELAQTWPQAESWQKLNQAVQAPVQLRTAANDLPLRADVSLQTVVREWDRAHQTEALQDRIRELSLLRQRVAPEVVALADSYRLVLETFLQSRDKSSLLYLFRKKAALNKTSEQAIRDLNSLDTQRLAMRPAPNPLALKSGTGL
jgi:hypothetical protein